MLGGIVAVVVAAAVAYAVLGPRSQNDSPSSSAPVVRSLAAFESCLDNQGVLTPSAETNDAMLRPAALACKTYVPLIASSRNPVAATQKALDQCLQDAQSKLRGSAGSLGGIGGVASAAVAQANARSARASFQKASAVCRAQSFDEPGGDIGAPGPAPTPVA